MTRSLTMLSALSLALVALAAAWTATSGARVHAGTDLSGTWSVTYSLTCDASFTQTGVSVTADVDCGGDVAGALSGTIEGGDFTLTGFFGALPLEVTGSLTASGESMIGTLSAAPIVLEGSFSGDRLSGSGMDLTGDWTITVADVFAGDCVVIIQQSGSDLEAEAECNDRPFGALGGTFEPGTGEIFLSGPFGTFAGIEIDGTVSADGQSFSGTWRITPLGGTGVIEGSREGKPPENGVPDDTTGPEDDADDEEEEPTAMPIVLPETGSGSASSGSLDFMLAAAVAAALAAAGAAYAVGHRMRAAR